MGSCYTAQEAQLVHYADLVGGDGDGGGRETQKGGDIYAYL